MALLTKVGSFVKRTSTGSQGITGVGFQPKAIIFWTSGSQQASGTWQQHIWQMLGFTTGPANSYSVAGSSRDANAASDTSRRMAAKAITLIEWGELLRAEADLQSFDADGFTLNWTSNIGGVEQIMYLALGGSDITGAKVVNWQHPGAVGNKAVTGVGFKPDLVLHTSAFVNAIPGSNTQIPICFGAMNKHGQQWSNSIFATDNTNPSNTGRMQQTDACITLTNQNGDGYYYQAHYVSMDADGFTTYFEKVGAAGEYFISLCLQGVSSKLGAFAKTTAAAPAQQGVSRVGFQPKACLFSAISKPAQGSPLAHANWGLGATDSSDGERAVAQVDVDAANPTQADSIWTSGRSINMGTGGPAIKNSAETLTLDSDGFTLNWVTNDTAEADEILYLALGDAGVDTFPVSAVTEL